MDRLQGPSIIPLKEENNVGRINRMKLNQSTWDHKTLHLLEKTSSEAVVFQKDANDSSLMQCKDHFICAHC
jgi:hypothetical protein